MPYWNNVVNLVTKGGEFFGKAAILATPQRSFAHLLTQSPYNTAHTGCLIETSARALSAISKSSVVSMFSSSSRSSGLI